MTLRKRLIWGLLLIALTTGIALGVGALIASRASSNDHVWGAAGGVAVGFAVVMGLVIIVPSKAWKWGGPAMVVCSFLGPLFS